MTQDQHPSWGGAVDVLRLTADRDEARWVAFDLAKAAVDDAVAVSPGADEVVRAVRRAIEGGCRWRADAYGVLIYVLNHGYEWRWLRASRRRYRGEFDEGIALEEAVFEALAGFDDLVREDVVDGDPERRAMACLLLGLVSRQPVLDAELVRMVFDVEHDDLVRGCAAEALIRLGADGAEFIGDPAAVVRHRVAWFYTRKRPDLGAKFPDDALDERISAVLREQESPEWRLRAEEI
jgi:hypothetical protein